MAGESLKGVRRRDLPQCFKEFRETVVVLDRCTKVLVSSYTTLLRCVTSLHISNMMMMPSGFAL
jgi:hypothetical protein